MMSMERIGSLQSLTTGSAGRTVFLPNQKLASAPASSRRSRNSSVQRLKLWPIQRERSYRSLTPLSRRKKSGLRERSSLEEFGKRGAVVCIGRGMDRRPRKPVWVVVYDDVLYCDFSRDDRCEFR